MPSADGTTQAATVVSRSQPVPPPRREQLFTFCRIQNDPGSGSVAERPLAVNAPHIKHNLPSASDLAIAKTKATLAKTEAAQKVAGAWKGELPPISLFLNYVLLSNVHYSHYRIGSVRRRQCCAGSWP